MKTFFSVIIVLIALAGQADAFLSDTVSIYGKMGKYTKKQSDDPKANAWLEQVLLSVKNKLKKDYPCLRIYTNSDLKKELQKLREQQLVGPGGSVEESNKMTQEDEMRHEEKIQDSINELGKVDQAKYKIVIDARPDPLVSINVIAVNILQKKGEFYRENRIYPSVSKALSDVERIADELADAFVNNASRDKWNNEVCPFKGDVEVNVLTKRRQKQEQLTFDYCNGIEHEGKKVESFTGDGSQIWKLKRFGNPDTEGTMEAATNEKILREEITGCHECASGRKGTWNFKDEIETAVTAKGLDTSTYRKGVSNNKDATIKLHFSPDGTYKVAIKAVSTESTKYSTHTTTAIGTCDNLNKKPKLEKQPLTIPLDRSFGPYTGTVRDKRLKEKQKIEIKDERTEEVTTYTIEFDLSRPEK